jgi:drug/metabolite transporter (DMT)-like permease
MSKVAAMFIGCTAMIGISSLFVVSAASLPLPQAALWAVVYGGLWLTLITIGTQWGVTQMDAGRSSIIIVAELVVAVASTAIIMQTQVQLFEIVGGVMVLAAAMLEGSRGEEPVLTV